MRAKVSISITDGKPPIGNYRGGEISLSQAEWSMLARALKYYAAKQDLNFGERKAIVGMVSQMDDAKAIAYREFGEIVKNGKVN